MSLTWLDLYSGLGGASQPAKDRGWRVVCVDIDPRFRPDVVGDCTKLPLRPFRVDVLWASPVCTDFAKWGLRCFYPAPPEPNLAQALALKATIDEFRPRYWVVENVWAARPWLTQIFGPVRALVPGHALWSNLALMLPNVKPHKAAIGHDQVANWSNRIKRDRNGRPFRQRPAVLKGPKRYDPTVQARSFIRHTKDASSLAATIPYEIGEAICAAVERAVP